MATMRLLRRDPVSRSGSARRVAAADPYHNIPPAAQGAAGHGFLLLENRSDITHVTAVTPQRGREERINAHGCCVQFQADIQKGMHEKDSSYDVLTMEDLEKQSSLWWGSW